MKTPKEKAEELVDKYSELGIGHPTSLLLPKRCALIAVDEILHQFIIVKSSTNDTNSLNERINFFNNVKQEILKL